MPTTVDKPTDILTTKEVAAMLHLEEGAVRRWYRMGRLKGMRMGNQLRFRRSAVLQALEIYEHGDDRKKRDPSMG